MKKWIGKLTAIFASAVLMMGAAMPVCATESKSAGNWPVDTGRTDCSISLTLKYKESGTNTEKNMTNGALSLYTVATVKEENGYSFDISGGQFASSEVVAGIPDMDSKTLEEKNADIAKALAVNIEGVEAKTAAVADGACKFENLTPGLYLVLQSKPSDGGVKINPFLVSIPGENGSYYIDAKPKTEVVVPPTTTPKITPTPTPGKPGTPGTPSSGSKTVLPLVSRAHRVHRPQDLRRFFRRQASCGGRSPCCAESDLHCWLAALR